METTNRFRQLELTNFIRPLSMTLRPRFNLECGSTTVVSEGLVTRTVSLAGISAALFGVSLMVLLR